MTRHYKSMWRTQSQGYGELEWLSPRKSPRAAGAEPTESSLSPQVPGAEMTESSEVQRVPKAEMTEVLAGPTGTKS